MDKRFFGGIDERDPHDLDKNNRWSIFNRLLGINFGKQKRFEKNIAFRNVAKTENVQEQAILRELAKKRHDTGLLFIMDSKMKLDEVCKKNFQEFIDLETAFADELPIVFKNYIQYDLLSPKTITARDYYPSTIGFKLVARQGAPNKGDEMQIRFATPEGLILDEDTSENQVQAWFDSINEVVVEYDRKTTFGFKSEIYGISQVGFRSYNPEDMHVKVNKLDELTDQAKRRQVEREMRKLEELYLQLGLMKLAPFNQLPSRINQADS